MFTPKPLDSIEIYCFNFGLPLCTFRIFFWGGGWQAVSFGGGVTVMEKREILVGWVTKVCLKCTKKLG